MPEMASLFRPALRLVVLAMAVGSVAAAGCARSANRPVSVSGRVLVDGRPAAGATVVFHRQGESNADAARPIGTTDANGEFHLTTQKANDGAVPGNYRVTVSWYAAAPAGKRAAEGDGPPPRNLLPEKYAKVETTPLEAIVTSKNGEPVSIDIKRK